MTEVLSTRITEAPPLRVVTSEDNERLTRVAAGTPMGEVFRRYWIPACLAAELPERDCPPVRVRLLGEDLVAFRDTTGAVGLIDAFCRHRRAPLFFGRNEECGLRCVYHGWKYDVTGQCVDLPSEPSSSRLIQHASIKAYPTFEAGGLIWTFMGPPGREPPRPDHEWLRVPATHLGVSKTYQACNYLQAIEGGIDTAHVSFLHNEDIGNQRQLGMLDRHPELEVEITDYGYRYVGIRQVRDDELYVRGYQFLMPCQKIQGAVLRLAGEIPPEGDLNEALREKVPTVYGHLWVPMDDETTAVYNLRYAPTPGGSPLPREYWLATEERSGRGPDAFVAGTFWLKQNLANDFLIDRGLQKTRTFTGIRGINTQDVAIQEGMGPIVDRTLELPGTTDKAVVAARELLLEATEAVERGEQPRGLAPESSRDVSAVDMVVPRGVRWQDAMKEGFQSSW